MMMISSEHCESPIEKRVKQQSLNRSQKSLTYLYTIWNTYVYLVLSMQFYYDLCVSYNNLRWECQKLSTYARQIRRNYLLEMYTKCCRSLFFFVSLWRARNGYSFFLARKKLRRLISQDVFRKRIFCCAK